MRLKRIDAVRFGALEGSCLSDLGEGLTVVLGPNESGKSTYTALVRNVLFGFPVGRGKAGDRFYRPASGERAGRLTFADEAGEWAIERTGEKKGGAVTVSALRGRERPELLTDLLGDLTEQTYRVVFGFGIDELDDIENGDDKYLAARLFAAGTGLDINPLDVRAALDKEASDLFAPRARIATVNALVTQMKDVRDTIRALETEASSFADEQARASRFAEELEPVRACRDELDLRVRGLERDAQRARDLTAEIAELGERLADLRTQAQAHERAAAQAPVDDRITAVTPELGALLEDTSLFRQRLESSRALLVAAATARQRIEELGPLPGAAADSVENRARVEAWASRRGALEGEMRAAERAAEQSEARARELTAGAGAPAARASRRPIVVWIALALGVAFAIAGAVAGQWLAAALGVLVAIGGVTLLFVRPAGVATELGPDGARSAADARANRGVADSAGAALEAEEAAWRTWLSECSLDAFGTDSAAVRTLLDRLKSRDELEAEAVRHEKDAERERAAAADWAQRVVSLARGFVELADSVTLDDTAGVAARVREALEANRAALERRNRALDSLEPLAAESERTAERLTKRRDDFEELLTAHGLEPAEAATRLGALAETAAGELAEVRERAERLSEELSSLRGRLDSEGRDAAMAIARQRLEGLRAKAAAEAQRYTVTALAVRLLDRARERFERERQPEVARVAGQVFSAMTDGRYVDVRVPLDGTGISVVTASGALKPSEELSRGTAEQLYLALRMGFLKSLQSGRSLPVLMDDVVVNFDSTRRAGAAAAIAELAAERQVIFFTCHEETAAVLADAVPGHTLIPLDRCALKG